MSKEDGALGAFIFCCFIMFIGGILIGHYVIEKDCNPFSDGISADDLTANPEYIDYEYRQQTKRVVNETGIPEEYSCEQIKVMIQTEVYPRWEAVYECKSTPEGEYSWCETARHPNTKESFVKYYLLECLEARG